MEPDRTAANIGVAIVTGAGRGIGKEIAMRLGREGRDVVLVARSSGDLEAVAAQLDADGVRALVVPADLGDLSSADTIVDRTIDRFGRLDLLVNNAGGAAPMPLGQTTVDDMEAAFRLNVSAAFALTRRAVPHLLASDRAGVINVSSRMDTLVARGLLTYGTVKAALSHMTRLLAVELAPRIRVNGISPGVVSTAGLEAALDPPTRQRIEAATPLHRLASVADVAAAAAWLASPDSSYVTGKIIELDGGAEWPVVPSDIPDLEKTAEPLASTDGPEL